MCKVDSAKWAQAWSAPGAINGLEQPRAQCGAGEAGSCVTVPGRAVSVPCATALSLLAQLMPWSAVTAGQSCSGAHTLLFAVRWPGITEQPQLQSLAAALPSSGAQLGLALLLLLHSSQRSWHGWQSSSRGRILLCCSVGTSRSIFHNFLEWITVSSAAAYF